MSLIGHFETIVPALFRKEKVEFRNEYKITTPDNDFLEIAIYKRDNKRVIIINHGLEGNYDRPYVLGLAAKLLENNFDVITWNYRGCGKEMNNKPIFYHSGATYDLATVVKHATDDCYYQWIGIAGFSLGGNLAIKFGGEDCFKFKKVGAIAGISVPFDLRASSLHLQSGINIGYSLHFLKTLKSKVVRKYKEKGIDTGLLNLKKCHSLLDFDEYFTGPIHGFDGAMAYYAASSCQFYIENINIPTLMLNAHNDPFFPIPKPNDVYCKNTMLVFDIPVRGGHVGFKQTDGSYYSDFRVLEFFKEHAT